MLRELILELGMRGKLVPQNANDEPASELLKQILAEKGKPIAKIPSSEQPYDLPNNWEWLKLGDCSGIERGGSPRPIQEYLTDDIDGLNWIKIGDTEKNSKFITYTNEKIKKEGLFKTRMVYPGDFLLTNSMSFGRPYITKIQGCIHDGWLRIHPLSMVDKDYLYNLLLSPYVYKSFTKSAAGAVVQNLNAEKVRDLLIPLPPFAEQLRIAAKIDELMVLCDQLEEQHSNAAEAHEKLVSHLLGTLTQSQNANDFSANWQRISMHFDALFTTEASIDALQQTLLQLAVMGKLVPQDTNDEPASELLKRIQAEKTKLVAEGKIKKDKPLAPISEDEKPFELPKRWEWARLELLANLITKGSSPKWQGVNYTDNTNDVLFVTSENVGSYSLLLDSPKFVETKFNEIEPRSILQKGDYLMNIVGASIGRTATFDRDDVANINQAVCLIRIENQALSKAYLLHFFNSQTCLEYMFDKQVDNARPNLSMGNIAKFLIPIAPQAEQQRIVAKVDALMALCDQLKTRIQQANQQQKAIANALVAQSIA